jgi:two-component system cell cycle sensor histidine kinase/response regulator CckA
MPTTPADRQEARLAAIGLLACSVVHDFANLLTVLNGHLHLIKLETDPGAQEEHLDSMAYVIQQCTELSTSVLAFARQQERPPQAVDLREICAELLRVLGRTVGARLDLKLEAPPSLPLVHADPTQMTQVVLNLCLNGCAAMSEGGRLLVQLDTAAQPLSQSSVQASRLFVRLRVSDTGGGIAPQVREQIFQPFFTTRGSEGTGLGLTIVSDITARHGGQVECHSVVGHGTCFTVYLPASSARH